MAEPKFSSASERSAWCLARRLKYLSYIEGGAIPRKQPVLQASASVPPRSGATGAAGAAAGTRPPASLSIIGA